MASSSDSAAVLAVAAQYLPYNGPCLIAVYMTWLLYGCFLVQMYHYYSFHCAGDRWLRLLVGASGLAATLHIGLTSAGQWGVFVEQWGDTNVWIHAPRPAGFASLTSALNGIIVQFFFVSRITLFSRHILARGFAAMISLASLLGFGGSIATTVVFLEGGSNSLRVENVQTAIRVWSISNVVCDVLIAATMITILSHAQARTSVKKMQNVLTRLIFQSIETGTVTAVNMLVYLISYETMNKLNTVYVIWVLISGPLYGNVLFFLLNSRQRNRDELSERDTSLVTMNLSGVLLDAAREGSNAAKMTTESHILAQYNAHATDTELDVLTDYTQTHSTFSG